MAKAQNKPPESPRSVPETPQEDPVIKILLEEYRQLAAAFDRNGSLTAALSPVIMTVITGFLFLGPQSQSGVLGFGALLVLFFLLISMGLMQSVVNHIGIKLAALEARIDKRLKLEKMEEGLSFYSDFVGTGFDKVKGFKPYFALLSSAVFILVALAYYKCWNAMSNWGLREWHKVLILLVPVLFHGLILKTMANVDRNAVEQITKIKNASMLKPTEDER